MNSGVLADPKPGARFNYFPVPDEWLDRAQRLRATCERHGVNLRAAAIQFPAAHPAVVSILAGVRSTAHLQEYPKFLAASLPAALWQDLVREGLLPESAPLPS
jgi:D-threo-aldose 1-dehydrogenase